ncbi:MULTISPECIES: UvrD-helicase domain-containing protein [unclassified Chitinophaga]|uniref:UvrD-helicase domain-containing protein n=1 Tax=unclassified Chitinophaga TaxID=2619133 RepID=UPI00300F96D2
MVEKKIALEPEVVDILKHINKKENFLLSGGAGSGKTYSLVHVIREVIDLYPTSHVACMTYTNAAVKEIEERVNHKNLMVSTIHDFLWSIIKSFQKDLKKALIFLINNKSLTTLLSDEETLEQNYFDNLIDGIQYKEWSRIKEGIISHDDLLIVANYMFEKHPRLCDILKDKFKFVFIDEYQDTHPKVIEIFLVHLKQSPKSNIIGFFGDSMQSIYEDGVGDISSYVSEGIVQEVKKEQNRRNPALVIDLANRLRTDGLKQIPSVDAAAPNMFSGEIKAGTIKFFYSTDNDLNNLRAALNWNFKDSKQTKELNLTHNLIAPKAGFTKLMEVYDKDPFIKLKNDILKKIKDNIINQKPAIDFSDDDSFDSVINKFALKDKTKTLRIDALLKDPLNVVLYSLLKDLPFSEVKKIYLNKDSLIDDKKQHEDDENKKGSKRDNLVKHLFKIQSIIHFYKDKQYNEFIKRTEIQINSVKKKADLKQIIDDFDSMVEHTIEEVIDFADQKGICKKDDKFIRFIDEHKYLFHRIKSLKFKEFQNLYYYLEGYTPFSTQHKIKGSEFNNVLVILDNGGWNSNYNFKNLFLGSGSENVLKNSQKIFYVCCTRAKENLAVFYYNPPIEVIAKAKEWFGPGNIHSV